MTHEVQERAAALSGILENGGETLSSRVVEAVYNCANDLVSCGEAALGLALLDKVAQGNLERGWRLRFDVLRVKAYRFSGQFESALILARRISTEQAMTLQEMTAEAQWLRVWEAASLWQTNRVEEAVENLLLLRTELLARPDSTVLATCMGELSSAELFRGRIGPARAHALEAIVSARRARTYNAEGTALGNLARIERSLCRWSAAIESLEEAVSLFEIHGSLLQATINRQLLGIIHWKRGRLVEASKVAQVCLRDAAAIGNSMQQAYAMQLLALIALHSGDQAKARELVGSVDQQLSHTRRSLLTAEYIGDTYLEQGDAKAALERYDAVWPLAMALVPKGDIIAELRRRKAEAYYLLERYQDAYAEAKGALLHCRELGDRYEEAATYRTLGLSAAALGKCDEAKQWFQQGFAYYDDIETPYEWGKLWMAYGDWLRGSNAGEHADKAGALEAYRAAKEHFEQMGAMGKLAEVQARIAEHFPQAPASAPEPAATASTADLIRPRRRPRGSGELDRRAAWAKDTFGFLTRNKVVLDLLRDVGKLARSHSPVLLLGESGTGKELVAAGIHKLSARTGNYMPINCGALPRDVIESELFGHTIGAFTGATRDKMGLFESCNGGTVFLDEVAEMSLDLQSKLLRFLETGEFRRIGSTKNVAVDVLVIAATNRDRETLESGESFRSDLYYRLAHAVITLPPLRRRGEDIDLLISHFLDDARAKHGKQVVLSTSARNLLIAHSWPGNVRQLRSTVNRLVVLSEPGVEIGAEMLELPAGEAPANLMEELGQAERRRIVEALAQASGVRTEAAKTLGMSRTTLIGKMKRFGIQ